MNRRLSLPQPVAAKAVCPMHHGRAAAERSAELGAGVRVWSAKGAGPYAPSPCRSCSRMRHVATHAGAAATGPSFVLPPTGATRCRLADRRQRPGNGRSVSAGGTLSVEEKYRHPDAASSTSRRKAKSSPLDEELLTQSLLTSLVYYSLLNRRISTDRIAKLQIKGAFLQIEGAKLQILCAFLQIRPEVARPRKNA